MLRRLQDLLQTVQAKLQGVALRTKLVLLLPCHAQLDLNVLDRLVMLAYALLRIIAEVTARLGELLFLSLLDFRKLIDLLDRLAREFAQILKRAPARLDLAARRLVDIEDLRLIRLDRADRTLENIIQRLGAELVDLSARKLRSALLLLHKHRRPLFPLKIFISLYNRRGLIFKEFDANINAYSTNRLIFHPVAVKLRRSAFLFI